MKKPHVVVFDAGIGGMTVLRQLDIQSHGVEYTYIADDQAFPYSTRTERFLQSHLEELFVRMINDIDFDVLVIACNTASTMVQRFIRERYPEIKLVVIVPGIKVICSQSESNLVSVIATPLTVAQRRIYELIGEFGALHEVTSIGAPQLAGLAESYIEHGVVDEVAVENEVSRAFVNKNGLKTDQVALGCTHYPLLLPVLKKVAPWPVCWVDPAKAVARYAISFIDLTVEGHNEIQFKYTSLDNTSALKETYRKISAKYPYRDL